jgi:Leucine-rich repeat (LRR) protein
MAGKDVKEIGLPEALRRIEEAKLSHAETLDLSKLELTTVPESIAQLATLRELDISDNQLVAIPGSIMQLEALEDVSIQRNQIAFIPESIAELANLTNLSLNHNQIAAIPDSIRQLENLKSLSLNSNHITAVPECITQLANLKELSLRDNQIALIPDFIGRLKSLEFLSLDHNQITAIPEAIGRLKRLEILSFNSNQIAAVPDTMGQLKRLEYLYLGHNQIADIPQSVAEMANLRALALDNNHIATIPDSIGLLANLTGLSLSNNQIRVIPDSIARLAHLASLHLDKNQLADLPESIAQIESLRNLNLDANPLAPELAAAYALGLEAVKRYLLAKQDAQVALNQAKLILVGEGEVGKSCLLGALSGDDWVEKRDTTHGIEIKSLKVTNPSSGVELTLNGWDFGGQRVYRPTHQLFFSSPAVYLVVWKPREGAVQGFVKEWIRLIKHREPEAKIIVVATHGGPGGRQPDLDRQDIWDEFGRETVVDFFHVDSRPPKYDKKNQKWRGRNKGIEDLRAAIARLAGALPDVGRSVPRRWQEASQALVETGEAYLPLTRVVDICRKCGMSDEEADDFIRISHRLGHLIHYGQDQRLKDFVILKPDWLATAVSFVLDDEETRNKYHGLVKSSRLSKLWSDRSRAPEFRYPTRVHSMFVALMERFDLSYQVAGTPLGGESDETILIAQLVPDERPEADIAREWGELPQQGDEQQMQTCRIVDAKGQSTTAEGLFYQLVVRLHKFSLGRDDFNKSVHWQRGLVLDDNYNGRALLELMGNDVRITVRAAYPGNLLAVLTSEVKWLVENFWRGLRCQVVVACVHPCGKSFPGTGVFEVKMLIEYKKQGWTQFPCNVPGCYTPQDIQRLLLNAPVHKSAIESLLTRNFDEVRSRLEDLGRQNMVLNQDVRRNMSLVEAAFRGLMQTIVDGAKDGPRLFSLEPVEMHAFNPAGWAKQKFRVTLWCEHSRLPLPLLNKNGSKGVYELDVTREWFVTAAPFLKMLSGTLSLILPVAASATKLVLDESAYKGIEKQLDFGKESAKAMLDLGEKAGDWFGEKEGLDTERAGLIRAEGGVLREFQAWLKEKDPSFGDLRRVLNKRQEFLWVHPDFENEY